MRSAVVLRMPTDLDGSSRLAVQHLLAEIPAFKNVHEHTLKAFDAALFLVLYRTWELPFRFYMAPANG
jgi:hypothetical protein